jgi:tetratricopeptide (TPR) repeat protein
MGLLYRIKGDYSKALEYFLSGLDIKRKTKATDKANACRNISMPSSCLPRSDNVIATLFIDNTKALSVAFVFRLMSSPDRKYTLSDLGKHDEGIEMLRQAFDIVDKYPGFLSGCCDLTNGTMGQIYLHKCDYVNAVKYFKS